MTKLIFCLAPLAAMAAAPLSAQADPTPEQVEAATRYALPHLFEGFRPPRRRPRARSRAWSRLISR